MNHTEAIEYCAPHACSLRAGRHHARLATIAQISATAFGVSIASMWETILGSVCDCCKRLYDAEVVLSG